MAVYRDDIWDERDAEGTQLSGAISLTVTPGHTLQDISTLAQTEQGLVVLTHLWWTARGPADDPYAPDRAQLARERERILTLQPAMIIPGHGAPFAPNDQTPV
jgi:glyoxylase-like metal-dependent hydrolase (beta-lactamase superfamily II)